MDKKDFILVHSTRTWLSLTENWIYNQVKHLPFRQIVLSDFKSAMQPTEINCSFREDFSSKLLNHFLERVFYRLFRKDLFRFLELKKLNTPYVLFSHYGTIGYRDLGLKPLKHITRFYGFDLKRVIADYPEYEERYKRLFSECDAFLTEGSFMKKELIAQGCPEHKIHVVHLGSEIWNKHHIRTYEENQKLNILMPAAFSERKGLVYALQAIGELKTSGGLKNFSLHIAGDAISEYKPDWEYKELMLETIKTYNLESETTMYGFVDKPRLYELALKCHIGVHPSVWAENGDSEGGYPVVIPDLMSTGLPFITTNHCDIPEVVQNNNGYICREKSVEDIKEAILHILKNPAELSAKSELARKTVEEKFNWEKLGKELEEFILNLVIPTHFK